MEAKEINQEFAMPTVLITGANRGLGLELTTQYCADGWNVIAACRNPSDGPELQVLDQKYPSLNVHALDVADFAAIDNLAATLKARPIDVLINNAGLFGPKAKAEGDPRQEFGHMDYDMWAQLFRVNTMAPMKMAEAFVGHVAASTQKRIVTITSSVGSITRADGQIHAYRTSKAAANMLMHNLSFDLQAKGIITAAFCPGWIKTRMGGPDAPLEAPEAMTRLRTVIADLTLSTSGRFWLYNGDLLPW
ncbi:MAG: SDR family oxidoreductase [Rhodospirillaceae bacterium]|nr:SDR family oxidoreductase [Rhodospirillaceae bacterium]